MKFKSDIEVQAGLKDSSGAAGTSGQVLSSNGTTVSWINSGAGIASDVQNLVKAGVAINKGQAVYVTGADGTNIIVGLASNNSEATSSKTLGLLDATVAINGMANVVQLGRLEGLDTSIATIGDAVWLGSNGNLIYGLANKPYAPLHLVYIGVVTRVNANNGEIFINVQNGFELKEIHDVDIVSTPPSNNEILAFEGGSVNLWKNKSISSIGGITGTGTTNTLPKFTGASSLGNSVVSETPYGINVQGTNGGDTLVLDKPSGASVAFKVNGVYTGQVGAVGNDLYVGSKSIYPAIVVKDGGNVGIGTSSPGGKLHVVGEGIFDDGTNGRLTFANASSQNDIYSTTTSFGGWKNLRLSSNELILSSGGTTERMRITSGGNVGIGTTTPNARLDVTNSSSNEIASFIGSSGVVPYKILNNVNVGEYWRGIFTGQNIITNATTGKPALRTGGYTGSAIAYSADSSQGYLGFFTTTSTTANTDLSERMRIFPDGNVGINVGNTNAGYKLDVNGTGRFLDNLTVNKEGGIIGIDASNNPRIGFVKKSGEQPFLAFASDPFLLKVSSGSEIFASNTFTTVLSIATSGAATFSSLAGTGTRLVTANASGVLSTTAGDAAPRYSSYVIVSHSSYTNICTINGDALASAIKMSFQGTSGNVVVNTTAEILVNHHQDISITSNSGFYSQLNIRIISNNNESYSIEAQVIGATTPTGLNIEVFPLNSEAVTFQGTLVTPGTTLIHTTRPGMYISATGGNQGDISASGSVYAGETIVSNGNATFGNTANRRVNYDSNGGNFRIKANAGGWAMGYFFDGSSGTYRGGYGGFGNADGLTYYWVGSDYNIPTMVVQPNQGYVGVGTVSPARKLHVVSSDNEGIFMEKSTTGGHWFNFRSADSNLWSMGAQPGLMGWYNRTDSTYKAVITDSGNFLIGTTTDAGYKLDVNGSVRVGGSSLIYFNTTGSPGSNFIGTINDYWLTLQCNRGNASRIDLTNGSGILFSDNGAERMSIASTGLKVNSLAGTGTRLVTADPNGVLSTTTDGAITTYNSTLTLNTSWQNTGITSATLTTQGVYLVTCLVNDYGVGGGQYSCTYVGTMFFYTAGTNGVNENEIPLHHSGHADNSRYIYLRTLSSVSAGDGKLYLQIKGNGTNSGNSTYSFTFKKLL